MSAPTRPEPPKVIYACPVCSQPATSVRDETEVLEQYDDGPGQPNDPRRLNTSPMRRMVPGRTVRRFRPCGHETPVPHVHGPRCDVATGVCDTRGS